MEESDNNADERIAEALIVAVVEEERGDLPTEDVLPRPPLMEHEQRLVQDLANLICLIGNELRNNQQLQQLIDRVRPEVNTTRDLARLVFEQGITWEGIAILIYVTGRLAVRMVTATARLLIRQTVEVFRTDLLDWIRAHGGWANSVSELASASVRTVGGVLRSPMLLCFVAVVALVVILLRRGS